MSTTLPPGQGPYQSGNPITLEAEFLDGTTPVDPDAVVFNLRTPDTLVTTYTYGVDDEVVRVSTGLYQCNLPTTWQPGQTYYNAVATNPDVTLPGEFYVTPSSVIPPAPAPGPQAPPCTAWLAGEDIRGTQYAQNTPQIVLDNVAVMASQLAFECLGRRWTGLCGPVTVRPARQCNSPGYSLGWGNPWWTWGYWQGDWGYDWGWGSQDQGRMCSCGYDSYVELAGYPVTEIVEVMLEGQAMATTFTDGSPTYRLDEWKFLTRLTDPANPEAPLHWPRCQRLDLPDTSRGTWSVTYKYGKAPPELALSAAKELAAQMLQAINGGSCQLPSNLRELVRQGATIQRITPLATELKSGATGMFLWDSAVAAYNPNALLRRPTVSSPDLQYPRRIGNE